MPRRKGLTERLSIISKRTSMRLWGAAAALVAAVLIILPFLGRAERPPSGSLSSANPTTTAVSPMQSSTPVLSKEYIYGSGRLIATMTSYEADVAPRPTGNGTVSLTDYVQVGRIAVGLDPPAAIGSEFQRTDCAPMSTSGDGQVSLSDYVQAGRYASALDPLKLAGGPTAPSGGQPFGGSSIQMRLASNTGSNDVDDVNVEFKRGEIGEVPLDVEMRGGENALSFTLSYDSGKAIFRDAVIAEDEFKDADLLVNARRASEGRVAIVFALLPGRTFRARTHKVLKLRFVPGKGDGTTTMRISFDDTVIKREMVAVDAKDLPQPSYRGARVTITGTSK